MPSKKGSSKILFWLKLLFGVACLFLLSMIYWSENLQEERLLRLEERIKTLEETPQSLVTKDDNTTAQEKADDDEKNLLQENSYFTTEILKLLPKNFSPSGTLRLAATGKVDDLLPFTNWANVAEWQSFCVPTCATFQFGKYGVLAKDIAHSLKQIPSDQEDVALFEVKIRKNIFWQPLDKKNFPTLLLAPHFSQRHPVSAYDFLLYFQAIKNPGVDVAGAVSLRQLFRDVIDLQVVDDHTFVVHYRQKKCIKEDGTFEYRLPFVAIRNIASLSPLPAFVFTYRADGKKIIEDDHDRTIYKDSSLWAQQFVNHFAKRVIVSCGPWEFSGASNNEVRFRRNRNYYIPNYALFDNMEIYLLSDPDAMWRDFMAQKIDACDLSCQNLVELEKFMKSQFYQEEEKKGHKVEKLVFPLRAFTFVAWNLKKPLFKSKKVRQALALSVDRKRLIEQNLNGYGQEISGPFFCYSESYNQNIAPWGFDPDLARRMLAEEGWQDSDGDGVVDKEIDGKRVPFRFKLTYYVKNVQTKAHVELIAMQLRQVGIDCELHGVDLTDLSNITQDKSFDAYCLGWQLTAPPENPEEIWHSKGADVKGSANTIGFSSQTADKIIEELEFEHNLEKRKALYHKFHAHIHDEAPYLFLYTPKITMVYWNWIQGLFIPRDRQDLIPGADVEEPSIVHSWKVL